MALASGARRDPLLLGITTAGVRTDSSGQDTLCCSLYQYGRRVATGEIDDPPFFLAWWEAAADADHRDPQTWRDANPAYGDLIDPEDFAAAALRTPRSRSSVRSGAISGCRRRRRGCRTAPGETASTSGPSRTSPDGARVRRVVLKRLHRARRRPDRGHPAHRRRRLLGTPTGSGHVLAGPPSPTSSRPSATRVGGGRFGRSCATRSGGPAPTRHWRRRACPSSSSHNRRSE
jgi:hypothetical protein